MFDSPLVWCSLVREWVALEENDSLCRKMHGCNVAVCPRSELFAAVALAARQAEADICAAGADSGTPQPGSDLRIFSRQTPHSSGSGAR